jgi:hypothetical protein
MVKLFSLSGGKMQPPPLTNLKFFLGKLGKNNFIFSLNHKAELLYFFGADK